MNMGFKWFTDNVLPILNSRNQNFQIDIVGRNSELLDISTLPNLVCHGTVDDVNPYLVDTHCVIVPLLHEAGTRFKIVEASSYRIPVISTSLGAEGLNFKNNTSILIVDSPNDWSSAMLKIINDKSFREFIGQSAYKTYLAQYSHDLQKKEAIQIIRKLFY